ncbi:hypothetical protein PPROV_000821200 [Pycnococcus provasolii]|uniref:Calmodulin-lysine N-methyltransferase n=1 Tax=Pycnococcus provasolii TaxID=41880 RepID=A0A830HX01_9CHLO|nr:hypothetical protein PPROV_000821200 [Pycnococcus provasolii]
MAAFEPSLPWWSRTFCGYNDRFSSHLCFPLNTAGSAAEATTQAVTSVGGGEKHLEKDDELSLHGVPARDGDGASSRNGESSWEELPLQVTVRQTFGSSASAQRDPGATGTTVWDAALVLAGFFVKWAERERKDTPPSKKKTQKQHFGLPCRRALELGAGTGLSGLALAAVGGASEYVLLTDIDALMPLLQENIQVNVDTVKASARRRGRERAPVVRAAPLTWATSAGVPVASSETKQGNKNKRQRHAVDDPPDLVFASDVVYRDSNVEPVFYTLQSLANAPSRRSPMHVLLALSLEHDAAAVARFERMLRDESGVTLSDVPCDFQHDVYRAPDTVRLMHIVWETL